MTSKLIRGQVNAVVRLAAPSEERGADQLPPAEFYSELSRFCEEMFEYYKGEFSQAFRERNLPLANHYSKRAAEKKRMAQKFAALAAAA